MTMMSQLHHLSHVTVLVDAALPASRVSHKGELNYHVLLRNAWGAFGPPLALSIHDSTYHPIPTQDGNITTCMNTRKNSSVFRSLMKMGNSQNHGICLLERGASWYPRGGASWHSERGAPYGIQGGGASW